MVAEQDYEWHQGEDFTINLVYKSGPLNAETPVDLTSYSFRMDIVGYNGRVLYIVNDKNIIDTDPNQAGNQGDMVFEATLGSAGQIDINLPRNLTLPGGVFYNYINTGKNTFTYDMFLRDASNKQRKIMSGNIKVDKSVTLWQ